MPATAKLLLFLALSGLPVLTAGRALAACSDGFTGTALGEAWTFVDYDKSASAGTAVVNGKLELNGRGKDVYDTLNEFVGVLRTDIQGDFDVSVKIESQFKSHPWAQAGILAATDISHLEKGGYVVVDVSPSHGYNLFTDTAGTVGRLDSHFGLGTTSVYPVWLRLAKVGKIFSAWYKIKEDAAWIVIAQGKTTLGDAAPSQIALVSTSHDSTESSKVVFDDFTCLGNTTTAILGGSSQRNRRPQARSGSTSLPTVDAGGRVSPKSESGQPIPAKARWNLGKP